MTYRADMVKQEMLAQLTVLTVISYNDQTRVVTFVQCRCKIIQSLSQDNTAN